MSTQHTGGQLHAHRDASITEVRMQDGTVIAQATKWGNAKVRRLVACWNKFDGISIENIEDNLPVKALAHRYNKALRERNELLDALKEVAEIFGDDWREGSTQRRLGDRARAAIAKTEGGAA